MICQYWWSQNEEVKKMHWVGWEKMKLPKEQGGLGFRDLYSFNLAMLARQGWRLLQSPDSLCARVLHAKYYPDGDLLSAKPQPGSFAEHSKRSRSFERRDHLKDWGWLTSSNLGRPMVPMGIHKTAVYT
jgi:hypothetical protein